jgi:hypothetical protein
MVLVLEGGRQISHDKDGFLVDNKSHTSNSAFTDTVHTIPHRMSIFLVLTAADLMKGDL